MCDSISFTTGDQKILTKAAVNGDGIELSGCDDEEE